MTPEEARRAARRILAEDRFRRKHPPQPLRGVLRWIGERFDPLSRLGHAVGSSSAWLTAVAVAVLVLAVAAASLLVRRRSIAVLGGSDRFRGEGRADDPSELERAADRAGRDGDLELALRLRFRAGLLRLDAAGALDYRPSLTTGAVVRAVPSPTLTGLARTLEEVVYGGRAASREDVEDARLRWPAVLAEQGKR